MKTSLIFALIPVSFLAACGTPSGGGGVGFGTSVGSAAPSQPTAQQSTPAPAAQSTGGGNASVALMSQCVRAAGVTGQFATTYTYANGTETRVVKAGDNVTQAQADAANQCIANG